MHDHGHNHREKNITIALILNILFSIIEFAGGLWTNSFAIMSDALHDLGDSMSLGTALVAERMARKGPDAEHTYGHQRFSVLSALLNASVLVGGSLFILSRTIPRIIHPETVNAKGMFWIAIIGVFFNTLAFFFLKGGHSLNEKVLSWHFIEDILGWIVILIGSVVLKFWPNPLIDPIMTIGFTVFIIYGVSKNMRETINVLLQGVPSQIDINSIKACLLSITGIKEVCNVHIWSLDGESHIFTGRITVTSKNTKRIKEEVRKKLIEKHIEHSTIEIEDE